jgi:hypothetical protein
MVWFILIEIGVWVMSTLLARSCDRIAAIGSTLVVGSSTNAGIIVLHVYHTFLNFFSLLMKIVLAPSESLTFDFYKIHSFFIFIKYV